MVFVIMEGMLTAPAGSTTSLLARKVYSAPLLLTITAHALFLSKIILFASVPLKISIFVEFAAMLKKELSEELRVWSLGSMVFISYWTPESVPLTKSTAVKKPSLAKAAFANKEKGLAEIGTETFSGPPSDQKGLELYLSEAF